MGDRPGIGPDRGARGPRGAEVDPARGAPGPRGAALDPHRGAAAPHLSDFDRGVLVGLLIGEGSFGGDGKQPQVTLRMHIRHEAIFRWLEARFPESRLYGPYHHGGRSYFQWMARGTTLVRDLLPLLDGALGPDLDGHAAERLGLMKERYAGYIQRERDRLRRLAAEGGS